MERRNGDSQNIIVRRSGSALTISGITVALVTAILGLVYNVGLTREKINTIESNYQILAPKLDAVSSKVDILNGKMDLLISGIKK
jgi:outer membrane murein-binding lipoprotein Lpp